MRADYKRARAMHDARSWPPLYLLFTPSACRGEPWGTLAAALDGGVGLVQWRVPWRDLAGVERCLALCRARGVPLIVNDDVELAVACGADGAHVGQSDLPAAQARRRLGPRARLGVSTHDPAQVRAAVAAGADHVGFGPCFATGTKGYAAGLPPGSLRAALAVAAVPVYAIGGIDAANLPELLAEGCSRIAVSRALLQAPDPAAAARRLVAMLAAQSNSIASPYE
jgi:thiamine-phosphate pyrophosphorylase